MTPLWRIGSFLRERQRWVLIALLVVLHLTLVAGADTAVGLMCWLVDVGLFILWQPFIQAERKLDASLGSSPAAILFGSNDLEKNFTLAEAGTRDGLEWLKATPKAKDTTFDEITIGLRNGVPEAMELRDSFGQTSVLAFKNFQKNPALAANHFKFVMPKGADVINN